MRSRTIDHRLASAASDMWVVMSELLTVLQDSERLGCGGTGRREGGDTRRDGGGILPIAVTFDELILRS